METHNANTFRDWYQMWLLANDVRFINCCRPQFVTFESNFVCCVSNINSICVHFAPINDKMNPMNNKYCVVAAVSLHLSLSCLSAIERLRLLPLTQQDGKKLELQRFECVFFSHSHHYIRIEFSLYFCGPNSIFSSRTSLSFSDKYFIFNIWSIQSKINL